MAKKEDAKKKTVAKKAPVKKTAVKKAAPAKKPTTKKTTPTAVAKKAAVKKVPIKATPKKATTKKVAVTKKTAEKVAKKATSTKAKKKVSGSLDKELESEASQDELTDSSEKMVSEELSDEEKRKQKRKNKLEKKIQKLGSDANRSLSKYLQEISKYDPLLPEREVELAIAVKQGSRRALKELVEANLRFVVSVAKDYQGQGLPLTDLINEGNLGLIKASERFDETRGFKFISYAVWWIRQSILQALAEHSRIVRLPLNRVGTISKINKAAERLEQEFERSPRADELARQLDMKPKEVNDAQRISRRHHSLDTPFSDDDKNCLMDVIEDNKTEAPDKELLMDSLQEEVSAALDTLKEREREVIRMYFGIDREYALTLNEIGEEFGLTRERVRQIKEKAIRRLRHRSRSRKLRQYLG
jgi:RNA polymerase primary sigma factor|tara:strand:+ start:7259 stop:8506 length:1248 start_codon:yes stop_codon:yes gene_type:complete